MDGALVTAFLEGKLTPEQFSTEVVEEVSACNEACRSHGEGRIVITDGPDTIVTRDHAKRLLKAVAYQRLTFEIANYTASCIIFGDFEFADDAVNEAVWLLEMGDLDEVTAEDVQTAIDRLSP
jgi:hypothetical protein